MPVRPMTDEEAERIFGGGRVLFGRMLPQLSSERFPASASEAATDLQNLPVDPALAPMQQTMDKASPASTTEKPPVSRD